MIQKTPTFSIVIANYNSGQYLEQAILSILNQDCKDFELLIVDGDSTDNSLEIIKKFKNNLSWWVSEKDNGQSNAFNKGFAKAKGDFFFWINADDLLLPGSIQLAKASIEKYPNYKWFAANTIFITKENAISKCSRGPKWHNYFINNGLIYVFGPTSIFHKTLFYEVNGFDESLNYTMDTDLWLRFKNNNHRFKRINRYFWAFRIHELSKTSHSFTEAPNKNIQKERDYIYKKNKHQLKKSGYFKQSVLKILSGTFLRSKYDTIIFKNKEVDKIELN